MSGVIGDAGVVVVVVVGTGIVAGAAWVEDPDAARLAYLASFVDYTLTDFACTQSHLPYPDHGLQAADAAAQDLSLVGGYYF